MKLVVLKNHSGGKILHRSLDPSKKRRLCFFHRLLVKMINIGRLFVAPFDGRLKHRLTFKFVSIVKLSICIWHTFENVLTFLNTHV